MENITLCMIPENDVNKMRKKISLEVLSLIVSGKPKEALRFFDLNARLTIHDMNELTALHSLDFFSS